MAPYAEATSPPSFNAAQSLAVAGPDSDLAIDVRDVNRVQKMCAYRKQRQKRGAFKQDGTRNDAVHGCLLFI